MTVKLMCFLVRRPDITREEFLDHWLNRHGPLVAEKMGRHVLRYEQYVRVADHPLGGDERYDGVTEQWFSSIDDFVAFVSDPAYAEFIEPDEGRFLDRDGLVWMTASEPNVVIDGPMG